MDVRMFLSNAAPGCTTFPDSGFVWCNSWASQQLAIIGQYTPWISARGRNRCSAEWDVQHLVNGHLSLSDVMSCYPPLWMWQWNHKWRFQYIHNHTYIYIYMANPPGRWNPCCNITVPPQTLDMPRCFLALDRTRATIPSFFCGASSQRVRIRWKFENSAGHWNLIGCPDRPRGKLWHGSYLVSTWVPLWQQVALASALRWKPERWAPWISWKVHQVSSLIGYCWLIVPMFESFSSFCLSDHLLFPPFHWKYGAFIFIHQWPAWFLTGDFASGSLFGRSWSSFFGRRTWGERYLAMQVLGISLGLWLKGFPMVCRMEKLSQEMWFEWMLKTMGWRIGMFTRYVFFLCRLQRLKPGGTVAARDRHSTVAPSRQDP